ncbi:MAG: PAS domain-containing protein, partial [Polyangiaceae bacterium]|nr:PAS domain-containing protein [Polyangiaceae bacterium]
MTGDNRLQLAALRQCLDQLTDPIFIKDRSHRWLDANEAFERLLGHPRAEFVGKDDSAYFPGDMVRVFWENDDLVFHSREPRSNEEQIRTPEGERTIWTRKFPVFDEQGAVWGLVG